MSIDPARFRSDIDHDRYQANIERHTHNGVHFYAIDYPDLPGCMSHGSTREEAIENGIDAFHAWVATAQAMGRAIPEPEFEPILFEEAELPVQHSVAPTYQPRRQRELALAA